MSIGLIGKKIGMTTLEKAIQYNKLAEKIFNYNITGA